MEIQALENKHSELRRRNLACKIQFWSDISLQLNPVSFGSQSIVFKTHATQARSQLLQPLHIFSTEVAIMQYIYICTELVTKGVHSLALENPRFCTAYSSRSRIDAPPPEFVINSGKKLIERKIDNLCSSKRRDYWTKRLCARWIPHVPCDDLTRSRHH
jgi:hypothetical protein